uniref:Uncharacterized protein n=1 Tax=Candidatus Kentrum sp. UNK TaxID=2126344 RepID=A0A451A100_9GAMM|nr:MAG: hypothetical protein BECKUNK1418G_GA0071005_100836 [Candidatus Kentron sp. UNK]
MYGADKVSAVVSSRCQKNKSPEKTDASIETHPLSILLLRASLLFQGNFGGAENRGGKRQ